MKMVGDFFSFQNGYAFKSKDFVREGKYKIVKIKELKDGLVKFFDDTAEVNLPDNFEFDKYIIQKGDVLFALTGDPVNKPNPLSWVGRVAYYNYDEPALLNQRVCKAIPKTDIPSDFLYYFFRQNREFYRLASKATGSASQANISTKTIEQHNINIPDIENVKTIVTFLKNIDDKISYNNRINRNLSEQAKILYKEWFIDFGPFEGEMPGDWHLGTVEEIIELHDSKRKPLSGRQRDDMEKIYPYYGATSIMDYVDNYIFDGIYLLLGEDGSVIDTEGYPILQYVFGKFWPNNHAHVITGEKGFSVEMLYLLFSLTNVQSIVTGAVQLKISQQNLKTVEVVIPSYEAITEFDEMIQPIFREIRRLRTENDKLTTLRDNLLPKLMSGELDVSDLDI